MKAALTVFIFSLLLIAGCTENGTRVKNGGLREIDAQRAMQMVRDGETNGNAPLLLDVRTPAEFAEGHIPGALNLDYRSPSFAGELEKLDKSKTYIVYCRAGNRSANARAVMERMGFINVYNLFGGFLEWEKEGQPSGR